MKLIGVEGQLKALKERIAKWGRGSKPLLLVGPPGSGKTASVHQVADELGYHVVEVDCSDFNFAEVRKVVVQKKLVPTVVLFEEVSLIPRGQARDFAELISASPVPVVLTALSLSDVHQSIVDACDVVRFYRLRARDLIKVAEEVAKQEGMCPNYEALTGDARQAVLSVYGSMGYEAEVGVAKRVERCLKSGSYEELDKRDLIYLLDSSYLNFYGAKLFWFVKAIEVADRAGRTFVLDGFKSANPKFESYFLTKLSLSRAGSKS